MASSHNLVGVSAPYSSRRPLEPDGGGSTQNIPRPTPSLPAFINILHIYLTNIDDGDNGPKRFLTDSSTFHEVAFSPQRPIIGSGHHFVVYASPFEKDEKLLQTDRDISKEVYCIKTPNLMSCSSVDDHNPKRKFRDEYYHTILQELRILLHPELHKHDNIINILGFNFHEDYDDYTIAWPVLIMEYAEFGTLDTLQQDVDLSQEPELARWLLLDIALGIQALHRCNIIHGDVKSENVLICRHPQRKHVARLSDFGLSVINPDASREKIYRLPGGTGIWSAPEWRECLDVEGLRMTDVFSFGLTAWRVLVNYPNPWKILDARMLGLEGIPDINEVAARAKATPGFADLVLWTVSGDVLARSYPRTVIEATLCQDASGRDLERALAALSLGQDGVLQRCVYSNTVGIQS
jgi:hypothetical protein